MLHCAYILMAFLETGRDSVTLTCDRSRWWLSLNVGKAWDRPCLGIGGWAAGTRLRTPGSRTTVSPLRWTVTPGHSAGENTFLTQIRGRRYGSGLLWWRDRAAWPILDPGPLESRCHLCPQDGKRPSRTHQFLRRQSWGPEEVTWLMLWGLGSLPASLLYYNRAIFLCRRESEWRTGWREC